MRLGNGNVMVMFQFTHPGGVRLHNTPRCTSVRAFQFTHPGGVRRRGLTFLNSQSCFNSRTREGCDSMFIGGLFVPYVFQFTHPGGVRLPGA